MRGNELGLNDVLLLFGEFPIPMRGNEVWEWQTGSTTAAVSNPHEG